MKNIIVFNASPRTNHGYTSKLLKSAIKGIEDAGGRIKEYNLNNLSVRACQGCLFCREYAGCGVTNDYLAPMYENIKNAHGILFGSPIYFYHITGQGKMWLDRLYPMVDNNFKPRFPGKNIGTIYVQGSKDRERNQGVFKEMDSYFTGFGWNPVDSLLCTGTDYDDFGFPEDLSLQAETLGRKIVEN